MERAACIIQIGVLFFFIFGALLCAAPAKIDRARKKVYRALRLITEKHSRQRLSRKHVLVYRLHGVAFVFGSILILANMGLQFGKFSEGEPPVRQSSMRRQAGNDPTLHRIVSEIVQPALHEHVGLVVAVIADDRSDISGFGRVDLHSNQPPDGETLFEIGSISKVFTGLLLADAIARNTVTLDTPVTSLLPSFAIDPDSPKHKITLEHLVTHTSGLPRMPAGLFRPSQIWTNVTAGDAYRRYTEASLLKSFANTRLRHEPGEHFAYSNLGFGILGLALSKLSGMEYHHMIETMLARPLGLTDTGVHLDENQRARLAAGYRSYKRLAAVYLAQRAANWDFPNGMAGAGGLRSTADDMLVFLAANMGRLQSGVTQTAHRSHRILFRDHHVRIGMGWLYTQLPQSQETIVWHNGGTGGYASFVGFTENGRFGVVILSNSTKRVDPIAHTILERLANEY